MIQFTTKQLDRLAKKAEKEQTAQQNKVKKVRSFEKGLIYRSLLCTCVCITLKTDVIQTT